MNIVSILFYYFFSLVRDSSWFKRDDILIKIDLWINSNLLDLYFEGRVNLIVITWIIKLHNPMIHIVNQINSHSVIIYYVAYME